MMDNFYSERYMELRDAIVQTSIIDAKELIKLIKKDVKKEKNEIKLNEIIMFYKSNRFDALLFDKNYRYKDFIEIYFNTEEKEIMKEIEKKYECCKKNIKNGYAFTTIDNLCYVKIGLFGCLLKDEKPLTFNYVYDNYKIIDLFDRNGQMVATTRTSGTIVNNRYYKLLYRSEINKKSFKRGCVFSILKKGKEITYYRFESYVKQILVSHDTNVIFDNVPDKKITGIYNYDGKLISYTEE